jgi:hypothetical protein
LQKQAVRLGIQFRVGTGKADMITEMIARAAVTSKQLT